MIIDVFCHYISEPIGKMIEEARSYPEDKVSGKSQKRQVAYPIQSADPEFRLALMDKYGIDIQAISLPAEALGGIDANGAAEMCRLSNDDNYALCKAYPDRFVNICIISLLDMESALNELDRSISELDCRGVTVASNQNGRGLDSPEYFQFYEKMVEHDLPLFIHPAHWESYPLVDEGMGWRMMSVFGWPFDTTQAAWRLIFGGVLDRFPSLKIVMHHMGAMFPYFVGRIETAYNRRLKEKLPRHISEYFKNIYGDTALSGGAPAAFPCGYAFFGPDRLMYGSDYPFGEEEGEKFIRENLAGVRSMNIAAEDMEKVLGGNAKKLLKIK